MSADDLDDILKALDYYDTLAFQHWARRKLRIKPGSVVHHIDGNARNFDLDNLRIVDPKENQQ